MKYLVITRKYLSSAEHQKLNSALGHGNWKYRNFFKLDEQELQEFLDSSRENTVVFYGRIDSAFISLNIKDKPSRFKALSENGELI